MSYTKILLGVFFIAYREFLEMTLIDLAHLTKNALTDDKMAQKKPLTFIKGVHFIYNFSFCSPGRAQIEPYW